MRRLTSSAEYLWSLTYGRLAIALTLVGATGLAAHYWTALPLLVVLPRLTVDMTRQR